MCWLTSVTIQLQTATQVDIVTLEDFVLPPFPRSREQDASTHLPLLRHALLEGGGLTAGPAPGKGGHIHCIIICSLNFILSSE